MALDPNAAIALMTRISSSDQLVDREIHPKDNMHSAGRTDAYYSVGQDALWNVAQAMMAYGLADAKTILDFPSGFGRVTRYLRAAFPDASIDVGDVWQEAVDHCAAQFSAKIVEIQPDLRTIIAGEYDVIYCGSLLTHFGEEKARELLDFLSAHLKIGGVALISCCGRKNLNREFQHFNANVFVSTDNLKSLSDNFYSGGYAFAPYPGETNYGRSFTPVSWFWSYMANRTDLTFRYAERSWDDNQDMFVLNRVS